MATQLSHHHKLETWHSLPGKVVLVTGASSGIGREFCLDLALARCRLILAARRIDKLQSLCSEINGQLPDSKNHQAVAIELDIAADGLAIEKNVQKAWEAFGHIDVLINNAGFRGSVSSSLELSEEEWNKVFKTNITGTWLVSKYVCKLMRESKRKGSVINISSIAGLERGLSFGSTAYSCSKASVNILTKVMALEMATYKIRVNSISPGLFKSEITENLMKKEWLNNVIIKIVPLKSIGTSNPALTSMVRYLIHDSSEYVTGNIFIVDDGITLPGVPIFSSL